MLNRKVSTLFAAAVIGFAFAGGYATATMMQPATFAQRWEIPAKSLAETAAMRDGLHNRALEILRSMKTKQEFTCVGGDCEAFKVRK